MKRLLVLGLLTGASLAQPAFLTSLERHPQFQAAWARLQAQELSARLAPDWLALDASGGWSRRELDEAEPCPFLSDPDPTNDVFCDFLSPDLPKEAGQGEVGLTLRPLPFGDYADRVRLAALDRAEARLDFRAARSALEAAALRAGLDAVRAEMGLRVAEDALRLAQTALATTRLRKQKGAATDRDLRAARIELEAARNRAQDARTAFELARAVLASFTNEPLPPAPWFREPLPEQEPPSVVRARLQLERARVGRQNAARDFLPVVELGYRKNLDEHHAVGVTLESRTLGARVYYAYNSYADPARSRTDAEWRIGARLNVAVDTWSRNETAALRMQAAEAALAAALRTAPIELRRYREAIERSVRAVKLAEEQLTDAVQAADETARRVDLGLAVPLEGLRAELARLQAEMELLEARHGVLRAQLDYLAYLAVPPSEVWR